MDYANIKVPFIGKTEIKRRAISFREKYWGNAVPVDIERIIEVDFGIDIIPVPELVRLCNTDALITSDWSAVYIDNERYLDERWHNRLQFSLAHEIGHWVLHRRLYSSFEITDLDGMYEFLDKIPGEQYGFIETQANYFASYVLVSLEKLRQARANILLMLEKQGVVTKEIQDIKMLNSYIAGPISELFGVSSQPIEILLNNEFGD